MILTESVGEIGYTPVMLLQLLNCITYLSCAILPTGKLGSTNGVKTHIYPISSVEFSLKITTYFLALLHSFGR